MEKRRIRCRMVERTKKERREEKQVVVEKRKM